MTSNLNALVTLLASALLINVVFMFSTLIQFKEDCNGLVFGSLLVSFVLEIMAFIMFFYLIS